MEDLPSEIHLHIFQYIKDCDLLKLPLVNHYFNDLLHDDSIWQSRIKGWFCNVYKTELITKAKYIEIIRRWPKKIKDARIQEFPNCQDLIPCHYHIYSDGNALKCFEYIPIEVLALPAYQMRIPLEFWFNQNHALALPLVAIPYGIRQINIEDELFFVIYNE